jgi:hypothetical protein
MAVWAFSMLWVFAKGQNELFRVNLVWMSAFGGSLDR